MGPEASTDAGSSVNSFRQRPSAPRGPVSCRPATATIGPAFPPLAAYHAARRLSGRLTIRQRDASVDHDMRDACRELLGLLECRVVLDGCGIEHDDVREI